MDGYSIAQNGIRQIPAVDHSRAILLVASAILFIHGLQTITIYVFFQANPRTGTAVNVVTSCLGLYLSSLVAIAFGYSEAKRGWSRPARWVLAYACLAGVSLLWTQSSSLLNAFGYWIGLVAELGSIALLLRCDQASRIAPAALKGFVWATVVVAFVAWTAPGTWELRLGQQEYLHPNIIGDQFALGALFCIYLANRFPSERRWRWICIILLFSLLRAVSKASIISFACAASFYFLRHSKLPARSQLKVFVLAMAMIAVSWQFISPYISMYTAGQNNVETLTGRTLIWSVSLDIAAERPWLGHGLASYISVVPNFGPFISRHAHNDLLQQFFNFGIVGLLLSSAVYASFYRHLRRSPVSRQRGLAFSVLIYGLLHGLVDASSVELILPSCVIFMLAEWTSPTSQPSFSGSESCAT
jgi:exopolysaccharide production protein ExoQ